MSEKKIRVHVECNRCGKKFTRNLGPKYVRDDGTSIPSSYCKSCQQIGKHKYKVRTSAEIMGDRDVEACGVKVFNREEIAEYERNNPRS